MLWAENWKPASSREHVGATIFWLLVWEMADEIKFILEMQIREPPHAIHLWRSSVSQYLYHHYIPHTVVKDTIPHIADSLFTLDNVPMNWGNLKLKKKEEKKEK